MMSVQVVGQLHPVLAERVDVGSGDGLVAKTANVSYAHVIHYNVENVWPFVALTSHFPLHCTACQLASTGIQCSVPPIHTMNFHQIAFSTVDGNYGCKKKENPYTCRSGHCLGLHALFHGTYRNKNKRNIKFHCWPCSA